MSSDQKLEEPKMEQNIAKNEEIAKEEGSNNVEKKVDQNPVAEKEVTRAVEVNVEKKQENEESKNEAVEDKDNSKGKEIVVESEEKKVEGESEGAGSSTNTLEKSSSFKEESNLPSDLKEHEKKALVALRSKLEEAILANKLFKEKKEKEKEATLPKDEAKEKEKSVEKESNVEEQSLTEEAEQKQEKEEVHEENKKKEEKEEGLREEDRKANEATNEKAKEEESETKESAIVVEEEGLVDKDIAIWGVPLLSSKGDKRTDVILLKFLRARDFKVNDAFEMLRDTLQWRKQNNIDSILNESFESDFGSTALMEGVDREGHPVCYNVFGALSSDEMYKKVLGIEEKREKMLRWRIQLMEKGIQKLDFNPGAVSMMVQINDLKSTPLPTKKDVRTAIRKAVELHQENYPEFAAKIIFINVPFWYYAFSAVFAPSFSQRTKNKFIYSRSARVIDALLKYISAEEIPAHYGGLKRENDTDFLVTDASKETFVKSGATETIEIPAPEGGGTLIWDLTVCGWEVSYKEEFVPSDEGSYTIIVQKTKKISMQDSSIRNTYKNNEPGKIVITIENGSYKKKRILYRFKTKNPSLESPRTGEPRTPKLSYVDVVRGETTIEAP